MAIITVRVSEEIRKKMREININWSEFIRKAIEEKIDEEKRKNLAKAVLRNERLKKKSLGEEKAEEIIRRFRDERYAGSCR
ncbi:MAG: hypothetical protein QXG36_08990 [Nitrososphaeria archaeon]